MGYLIRIIESKFRIPATKVAAAAEALATHPACKDQRISRKSTFEDIVETVFEAAFKVEVEVELDENGDVIGIYGSMLKRGWLESVHELLAPFVAKGSVLILLGEDGRQFKLSFNGKTMRQQEGQVTFVNR
jgi:hypothetical protein